MKNQLKVAIATFLLVSLGVFLNIHPEVEASSGETTGIITVNNINVYKGPGKSFGVTGSKISKGELVNSYQTENGWTYLESDATQGWVWGEFVQKSTGIGVLNSQWANLYNGASKSSGVVGKVEDSNSLVLFESKNGWKHVYVNGRSAWIWGEFVTNNSGMGIITSTYANLYNGPGKANEIKGSIENGTTIKLGELKNGWRKIFLNGETAWVWDSNISTSSYLTVYSGKITNPSFANLYNSNRKSNGVKGRINNGEEVTIFQKRDGWLYVQGKSIEGWVWGEYANSIHMTARITNTTFANIYSKSNGSSEKKGRINQNQVVKVQEKQNNWIKVQSGDTTGWVWHEFVRNQMNIQANSVGVENTSETINVYRGPGKKYSTIDKIPKDANVTIYNLNNGWRYIHAGFVQGWVWGAYVDPLGAMTVILDPGHGQNDPGAIGFNLKEKDVVLDIGQRANKLFNEKSPINVKMTRNADRSEVTANGSDITTADSLRLRVDFAKKHKSSNEDIFISLHANAFDGEVEGGETFYPFSRSINSYVSDSKMLAESIQTRLIEYMQLEDRGIKQGNFHVLRENIMPAVLVESGFIDNKSDNDKLKSEYWRQQAAYAVYQGTLDYYEKKGYNVEEYDL